MDKLIITACICGAEVTKEHNPAVPYTVEEMVREAKSAYDAGASLLHIHVREDDGTPTQSKDRFEVILNAIRKECPDAILQVSTGGAVGMTNDERLQPLLLSRIILKSPLLTLDIRDEMFGEISIHITSWIKNRKLEGKSYARKWDIIASPSFLHSWI